MARKCRAKVPQLEIRAAIAGQEIGGINNGPCNKLKHSPETLALLVERHLTSHAAILDEVICAT